MLTFRTRLVSKLLNHKTLEMVCGEGSLVLLQVASEPWEGPGSSSSPAGITSRKDVGNKSLAPLMSMKPVLTEYDVHGQGRMLSA